MVKTCKNIWNPQPLGAETYVCSWCLQHQTHPSYGQVTALGVVSTRSPGLSIGSYSPGKKNDWPTWRTRSTWPRPTGTLANWATWLPLGPSTSEVDPIKFSELPLFSAQLWATSSLFNPFSLREAMYITRKLEITRSSWRVTSFDQLTPARQVPGIMGIYLINDDCYQSLEGSSIPTPVPSLFHPWPSWMASVNSASIAFLGGKSMAMGYGSRPMESTVIYMTIAVTRILTQKNVLQYSRNDLSPNDSEYWSKPVLGFPPGAAASLTAHW